jgi:hypothetical protein
MNEGLTDVGAPGTDLAEGLSQTAFSERRIQ